MTQTNARFLFVVAGQAPNGTDRLARSLILARALAECGGACSLLARSEVTDRLEDLAPGMARTSLSSDSAEAIGKAASRLDYDAVIFDHPGLGREDHLNLAADRPAVVLDDDPCRELGGQIIVNPRPDLPPDAYSGLAPENVEVLAGPLFALMTGDFARLRITRPDAVGPVRRMVLFLNESTSPETTVRVIDHIRPRLGEVCLEILLPESLMSLRGLVRIAARDPRLTLHSHPLERARIAARADIAIATLGQDIWEAASLGLPMIAIMTSGSADGTAQRLAEIEAAIIVDAADAAFEARLERAFVRLVADAALRTRLSANAAGMTDGAGAERIAQKLIGLLPS